jgi:hypothetical protein
MGGRDALHLTDEPGVAAAVSWYGVPPRQAGKGPALAFFGGKDMGPSLEEARRFEAAARGTATEVRVYPEAQHGFADPQNPWGGYDAAAAADSWTRALAFLAARVAPVAGDAELRGAVDCVVAAWNAHDAEAARRCYVEGAVSRNAHGVVPVDWELARGLRAFDRVARARFRAEVRSTDGGAVEYRLHETNDFLAALGLDGASAIWRYVVRDGRIAEEDLMEADGTFRIRLRKLTAWGRSTKPQGWESVVDAEGSVRFDGTTAPVLIRLAKEFAALP